MAVLALIDTGAPAGSMEIPIAANRNVGAVATETGYYLPTRASVMGYDASQVAGSQSVPVAARNFDADADIAATLIGLTTNSRMAVFDYGATNWGRLSGDVPSSYAAAGRATNVIEAAWANALAVGIDNTGAAVLRPVEARDANAAADVAAALIGLTTNSRMAILDYASADWAQLRGTSATSAAVGPAESELGAFVYQARADEFAAARRGKRFYGTHQTPGTLITAQTSFVATTPTLMYRINSAAIRAIIRSINLSVANTPGGVVYVTLAIDTADRWSAGGTLVTLQNSNEESATAAVGLFYTNPTATAAGGGTRYLGTWIVPASAAANYDVDVADGILLGPTASTLLVYVWSATTAADLVFTVDLEEVA
jgi:hypothetical protein